MNLPIIPDHCFKVDFGAIGASNTSVERRCRLATCFPDLIVIQRTFNYLGDRAVLASSKPACKITRFGAAYGKLRFGHMELLCRKY